MDEEKKSDADLISEKITDQKCRKTILNIYKQSIKVSFDPEKQKPLNRIHTLCIFFDFFADNPEMWHIPEEHDALPKQTTRATKRKRRAETV